jgi:hypothetical protein
MYYPAIKLHQLYSLNVCEDVDVIFEELEMVDINNLSEVINTKKYDKIDIVPTIFSINTVEKTMTITGHKINDRTYIINKTGKGDIMFVNYNCEKETVVKGIDYLYHMTNNLIKRT